MINSGGVLKVKKMFCYRSWDQRRDDLIVVTVWLIMLSYALAANILILVGIARSASMRTATRFFFRTRLLHLSRRWDWLELHDSHSRDPHRCRNPNSQSKLFNCGTACGEIWYKGNRVVCCETNSFSLKKKKSFQIERKQWKMYCWPKLPLLRVEMCSVASQKLWLSECLVQRN